MTEVVSFRPTDEMEEEIQRETDLADGDLSRSLAAKRLAGEAVEARNTPFWYRRDMSRRHRAQIEDARDDAEDDDDVVEKLLVKAVEAEREDALDAVGAGDELREKVEQKREDGETLEAAVTRLIRKAAERKERTFFDEVKLTASIVALMLLSSGITAYRGFGIALSVIILMTIYSLAYPYVAPIIAKRFGV